MEEKHVPLYGFLVIENPLLSQLVIRAFKHSPDNDEMIPISLPLDVYHALDERKIVYSIADDAFGKPVTFTSMGALYSALDAVFNFKHKADCALEGDFKTPQPGVYLVSFHEVH